MNVRMMLCIVNVHTYIYHVNGDMTHRKRRSSSFHDVDITSGCVTLIVEGQCNSTSQSECM